MAITKAKAVAFSTALLLGGCSFVEDSLFPSVSTDQRPGERVQVQPSMTVRQETITTGPTSSTAVGHKVAGLRGELAQLQANLARQEQELLGLRAKTIGDSQQYHGTVAAISARLQLGTTPGNPALLQQWREAQGELESINTDVLAMNRLNNEVHTASSTAAYLLNAIQATRSLPGAIEEDHRQLRIMEDETQRATVNIERLLSELSQDINRQQQYVGGQRSDLTTLASGIQAGQLYAQSLGMQVTPVSTVTPLAATPGAYDRPLMVIKFTKANPQYEQRLYDTVKSALDRRPSAIFDVIAVSPRKGTAGETALGATNARRNAEQVLRSLSDMGLPPSRVRMSSMQSDTAAGGEVHLFVR